MNLPKLRLLKADVEGMELDVIKGAVKTIKSVPRPLAARLRLWGPCAGQGG